MLVMGTKFQCNSIKTMYGNCSRNFLTENNQPYGEPCIPVKFCWQRYNEVSEIVHVYRRVKTSGSMLYPFIPPVLSCF